ncbi:MAG: hypothetical protein E6K16_05275 [Methanobacteriota archaeon]|nr:MAG: hypothetical protein E6K16_05275 [Euryarchaeota archaeon]
MANARQSTMAQVRKTVSTSLAAAFGFVIALLWNGVVTSGLTVAGISTTAPVNVTAWAFFVVTAVVLTVVMVILIILVGRLAPKEPEEG